MSIAALSDDPKDNPQTNFLWIIIAGGLSAVIFAVGLFLFASNTAYREPYHGWYLFGFFVSTIGMGVAFGTKRVSLGIFLFILVAGILTLSVLKFEWRKKLTLRMTADNPVTVLGDYATVLPTFEEYWYPYSIQPNWVKFDEECFIPVMQNREPAPECKSKDAIFTTYRIQVISEMTNRFQAMKATAGKIDRKELATKQAYESCLQDNSCVMVPLLPPDVDPAAVEVDSDQYQKERVAFWQLIDSKDMTSALCDYMALCKVLTKSGALTRNDFSS